MIKVFIDGSSGTTGLNIKSRLGAREDVTLITLGENERKDVSARADAIRSSDVSFLCLPDDAAREIVSQVPDAPSVIIDTSTAHRVAPGWTYGFAELKGRRAMIASSNRIANPGCHASGFIALAAPLVNAGVIKKDASLTCFSLTGYSGGGKKMIADYEDPLRADALKAPAMYSLAQKHKHLPEMVNECRLERAPVFCPIVSSYYAGMEVVVPLSANDVKCGIDDIKAVYRSVYTGKVVKFAESVAENGFLSAGAFAGRDDMEISVLGSDDRITLVARFDNLGKGACGAAIQNMNIALSLPEETGLVL